MLIDKVAPFTTDQDRIELAEYSRQMEAIIKSASNISAEMKAAQTEEQLKELSDRSKRIFVDQLGEVEDQRTALYKEIEQRYIDSLAGDISAILDDVKEIVNATEKEEYIADQKAVTAALKPILEGPPRPGSTKEARRAAKQMAVKGYVNCYYFILRRIRVQLNALDYYNSEEGNAQAIAIVEARAGEFYSKPKNANTNGKPATQNMQALPVNIREDKTTGGLLSLPTGPTTSLLYDVLGGGDLYQLADRRRGYNRNIRLQVDEDGDRRKISYTKDKTEVSLVIEDIRKIANRNPQTRKILTRILLHIKEQALASGGLYRDQVSFELRELVGEGQYKNLETARQGFYNATDTLTGIKVSGKMESGKKKTIQKGGHVVLFKAAKVDNATCTIYLNELFEWGLIAPFFTGLPDYYFELPDRAAELLLYIFSLARQNTKQLADPGYFTISFRAIQGRLNLPNEIQNGKPINNPKRDIKDAIENAVEQIEEKHYKYTGPLPPGKEPEFALELLCDPEAPIKTYLDEGKLKVALKGQYASKFIEVSQKTTARIEAARKRQEGIEDRAKALTIAKSEINKK